MPRACCLCAILPLVLAGMLHAAEPAPDAVDFNRSIRPILSNNCFKCHGPDAAERQSGLRLDQREAALAPAESGEVAIVPGKSAASELWKRISSTDDEQRMPPADSNKKLSAAEKELLRKWLDQGAPYQSHWSFVAPVRPPLPSVRNATWPRTEVDRFILARLEAEGLTPSPEADRPTLIRRLAFDLIGLPPTPAEVDAFLADPGPDAYERLVDRLLASPHFGERLALDWLDAARFADTHGYHIDSGRDMTRWREWVIDAFNANMPFDRFTVAQLAGDLLPEATLADRIASGFNRNHMINFEGGAIPEEYHAAYIVDRVNTVGTVFLGLTVGCAQCHDHKYDPLTQRDYYRLYAMFHNVPENGLDGNQGNAVPLVKAPSRGEQQQLARLTAEVRTLEAQLAGPLSEVDAAQVAWEQTAGKETAVTWKPVQPQAVASEGGASLTVASDRSVDVAGANPATDTYTLSCVVEAGRVTALRIEALADDKLPSKGPGRAHNGNVVLTNVSAEIAAAGKSADKRAIKFKTATADFSQETFPAAYAIDENLQSGWALDPQVGKSHALVLELAEPLEALGGTLALSIAFQSQFGQHQLGKFRVALTDAPNPHSAGRLPAAVAQALAVEPSQRSDAQRNEIRDHFRQHVNEQSRELQARLAATRKSAADFEKGISSAMVMVEMPKPRDTFILVRGQYDKKSERVTAGVPEFLPSLSAGDTANRLALARWLIEPTHPLTARVTVNRMWQSLFGVGLVKTAEDFGVQGELPSHPQLLDWLAVEFRQSSSGAGAWNVKALFKLLVMSAAYRQSSAVTASLYGKDPENRLLARGPRHRLQAEFIRDQALAASGLLDGRIGGHSVSPYQPAGIWEELASRADGGNWSAQSYVQSHGADLYRRTMYTFWKRTAPPPSLMTFDAPDRETCTVRRSRTNTPLQALVLMNDPTYVEAARKMAERILREGGDATRPRIVWAFRLATARRPSDVETAVLARIYDRQLEVFRRDAAAATKLLSVGEAPRDARFDAAELAAWTAVASVILNLDETLTKG